jgi:acetate kinase
MTILVLNAGSSSQKSCLLHRLRSHIGAMLTGLGGLDTLAFRAGVGEHSAAVRAAACEAFAFLGLKVDPEKNAQSQAHRDIATPDSTVRILAIDAEEDWAIARECWKFTQGQDNAKFVTPAHFVSRPSDLRES